MGDQEASGESADVTWPLGATTVYGTPVKPPGPGPFPAVVLVAGSGPTDRDWNAPFLPGSNGSARLLAEAVARAEIASLRYDKRASGPHAGENMHVLIGTLSMQSHVEELAGAVHTLARQGYVRDGRIFALANSEGTLHALTYQIHGPAIPFAGLVLTGPPGRAVGAVAHSQLAAQAAGLPNGEALRALYDAAIDRFLAGEPITPDPALPEGVQLLLHGLETPANLPFACELWTADATSLLGQVDVPVLVIIGGIFLVVVLAVILFWPTAQSRTPADRFLTGTRSRDDDRCWFGGGLFYYNPDDPAPLVPNRYFVGLTLNFGHPLAKVLVVLVVGLLLIPVALAIAFNLPSAGCHRFGCLP